MYSGWIFLMTDDKNYSNLENLFTSWFQSYLKETQLHVLLFIIELVKLIFDIYILHHHLSCFHFFKLIVIVLCKYG